MNKLLTVIFLIFAMSFTTLAADKETAKSKSKAQIITIETATIRGNQELPTVLYLVPWQPPEINPLNDSQTQDLTKNTIELIDRNSFKRLIEYHDRFKEINTPQSNSLFGK
jgi:hypothetical protein